MKETNVINNSDLVQPIESNEYVLDDIFLSEFDGAGDMMMLNQQSGARATDLKLSSILGDFDQDTDCADTDDSVVWVMHNFGVDDPFLPYTCSTTLDIMVS
jgi:hypothetical protein